MIIVFLIFSLFLFDLTLINLINSYFSSILLSFPSSSIFFFFFYFLAFFSLTFYSFFSPPTPFLCDELPSSLFSSLLRLLIIQLSLLFSSLYLHLLSFLCCSSFTFPSLPFVLLLLCWLIPLLSSPPSLFLSSSFPPPLPLFSFLSIPSPSLSLQISTCLR